MRKLITTLTATILIVGSIAWKAEAAIVTGVGSSPLLTKTYSPIERVDCFLSPCSHPDSYYHEPYYRPYRYGYNRYGYNGYGYRPYGYYYGYGSRPYGYGYGWRY
jgi:hypothetical protein